LPALVPNATLDSSAGQATAACPYAPLEVRFHDKQIWSRKEIRRFSPRLQPWGQQRLFRLVGGLFAAIGGIFVVVGLVLVVTL
jgi:hypothetical protein